MHYVRDVTQGEDHSSVRAGSGPQVMAALRNTALKLNRLEGHADIARAQRQASWRPHTTLQTINVPRQDLGAGQGLPCRRRQVMVWLPVGGR